MCLVEGRYRILARNPLAKLIWEAEREMGGEIRFVLVKLVVIT
jgi:hypothetical protein